MRVVLQRVEAASVSAGDAEIGVIGTGFLLLVGIGQDDDEQTIEKMADKVVGLRIFDDGEGKMNLALPDVDGSILAVSQFTLYGDATRGRRPSFSRAASPDAARTLFNLFVRSLEQHGRPVATGRFGAHMRVTLTNDGPVTLILDSEMI